RGTFLQNHGQGNIMRKRIYNWQGQRFVYLWLEGAAGRTAEQQSQGLFDRAGKELAAHGLALDRNVVRTRVYGRTRETRDIDSAEIELVEGYSRPGKLVEIEVTAKR